LFLVYKKKKKITKQTNKQTTKQKKNASLAVVVGYSITALQKPNKATNKPFTG